LKAGYLCLGCAQLLQISDSRFGFLKAIPLRVAMLLATSVFPLQASNPGFDTLVNYDTAWTFVYDGGKSTNSFKSPLDDYYYDLRIFPDGSHFCVDTAPDTTDWNWIFLTKIDGNGKPLWKKKYVKSGRGRSIVSAKNGDLIIGGDRGLSPFLMRVDSIGNVKWTQWIYDSVNNKKSILLQNATINCVRETRRGTIICSAGDPYPFNEGSPLNNYAAYLEFDSAGTLIHSREWKDVTGYAIRGFDIEETKGGEYLMAGNEAVFYLDTTGRPE
jgi:hypothetical protein